MKAGQWEEAVTAYQEELREDLANPRLEAKLATARARAGSFHADRGRALLKERELTGAIEELKRALYLNPTNPEYHTLLAEALRYKDGRDHLGAGQKLLKAGRWDEAAEEFEQALARDPDLKAAQDGLVQIAERQRGGRNTIFTKASRQPITLEFRNARTKEVLEVLARAGGINFMFDKDLRDDPITIFLKDSTFEEALNLILATQNLFMRRVGIDTILIIPKSKQKMDQYQDLLIRTFYVSNGKAKDLVNLLRTMLESKRIYVNEDVNAIVIRDTPDKVRLAERIITANDRKPGEVMFEIEVLEVDKSKTDLFGVNFAKQAGAAVIPPGLGSPGISGGPTFPGTNTVLFNWQQLRSLNPTSYLFTLPTSVILDFLRTEANAKTLANPKLRVVNNKQAKINIGDKVPILLSTTNTIPGVAGGTVPTQSTITSIEYKDVGVKLSVEPNIHLNAQVTLKLALEVTRLGDQVILQTNPLIQQFKFGTRTAETILTLKDDESVVIGGLLQEEDRKTISKVPGIGDIPIMGWLFKHRQRDTVITDVILTITPRIVRGLEMPGMDEQAFWSGTEEAYSVKPLFDAGRGVDMAAAAPTASMPPAALPPVPVPPAVAPAKTAMLSMRPSDATMSRGSEIKVDLLVANVDALTESTVTVRYDPKVLEFRQALEGEFFKREGVAGMVVDANPITGMVTLQVKRPPGQKGVNGDGVIATVVFAAKGSGVSPLAFQNIQLVNAGNTPVAVSSSQGIMRVQ